MHRYLFIPLLILLSPAAFSAEPSPAIPSFNIDKSLIKDDDNRLNELTFSSATQSAKWEVGGLVSGITLLGMFSWDWGSSKFKMNSEGWFGMDTGSGGADKVGHLYTTYAMSEWLAYRLRTKNNNHHDSALYGALLGWSLMFYVELFDGFSSDHGFSNHDLLMNTIGSGFSYYKNTVPWLKDTMDLRVEYLPSKAMKGLHPMTDYTGYKYIMAFKPAGLDTFKNSYLRYFELHLGYYSRGFKKEDAPYFDERTTSLYSAISINLSELIFKKIKRDPHKVYQKMNSFFQYYQVPNLYIDSDIKNRTGPRR
ncbi:DUF2279 domain-containing protein [Pseudomonas sp. HK3]